MVKLSIMLYSYNEISVWEIYTKGVTSDNSIENIFLSFSVKQ